MIAFILNFPYTFAGFITGLLSGIISINWNDKNKALIIDVKSFWWEFGYLKNSRAMTIGHTVLLSPKILENDLEHELIHVSQYREYPFIFPFLYYWELVRKGYIGNKFEKEAYKNAGNIFTDDKPR